MFSKTATTLLLLLTTLLGAGVLAIPASAATLTSDTSPRLLPLPVTDSDYYDDGASSPDKVELGRSLFFDKILSGNHNLSCATCHHPSLATGDGLALPLGEGATGLGPARRAGDTEALAVHERIPRNSPPLYNLGAREYVRMFHDGRVETDPQGYYEAGFISPAKWKLPTGLDNVLAAQAMFPPTSPGEMAGQKGENDVADARSMNNVAGPNGVWELLAGRLAAIPEYVDMFRAAFPDQVNGPEDITFVQAANALAAFQATAFRADDSPFDQYLRGAASALDDEAQRGMELFYGRAGCGDCHSGKFQTDHSFHAIAMPQIGPGKGDGKDASYWRATGWSAFVEDFGRGRETFETQDRYKFRTPSLRNVGETGPWGHDGAFDSLEAVVRHHLDPVASLAAYSLNAHTLPQLDGIMELTMNRSELGHNWLSENRLQGFLARDEWVLSDPTLRQRLADANELEVIALGDSEVDALVAFLHSLTDQSSLRADGIVPAQVPSGLPVED